MNAPTITHIAETVLYSDSLADAERFYREVLRFGVARREDRFVAFHVAKDQVLLVFARGQSVNDMPVPGGTVSAHDGSGPLHVCFGIEEGDLLVWEEHLRTNGVEIEHRVDWPHGSKSLYFRDPDGHAVELATPGLWDAPAGS